MDNIATDGAAGFESLEKIVVELQTLGAAQKWCSEIKSALKESRRYLKTEYQVHSRDDQSSACLGHYQAFALSDNADESLKIECDHAYDTVCKGCEVLKNVIQEIEEQVRAVVKKRRKTTTKKKKTKAMIKNSSAKLARK